MINMWRALGGVPPGGSGPSVKARCASRVARAAISAAMAAAGAACTAGASKLAPGTSLRPTPSAAISGPQVARANRAVQAMNAMAKVLGADPKRRFYDKIAEEESKATDSEEETKAPEGGFEGPHPPTEGECAGGNSQGPRSMGTQAMRVKPRRIIDTAHAPGTPSSHAEAMRKWIHSRAGQAAQRRLAAPAQPAPVVVAKLALMSPRAGDSPSPE